MTRLYLNKKDKLPYLHPDKHDKAVCQCALQTKKCNLAHWENTVKKIVLVDASPRPHGNSETIVDTLAQDLRGEDIVVFKVRQKHLNPCLACGTCQGKAEIFCAQKDDMSLLVGDIAHCDSLVLASPVYFHQISAQAKAFIDRTYCFFNAALPGMSKVSPRGKKAALVCSFWGGPESTYARYAAETVKSFSVIGADEFASMAFGGIPEPGEVQNHPEYMKRIHALAQWLKS